jgi:predicted transcriptional regulator
MEKDRDNKKNSTINKIYEYLKKPQKVNIYCKILTENADDKNKIKKITTGSNTN